MVENVIQTKCGITINFDMSVKNIISEKDYTWDPATCICKNLKYLVSITDA